MTKLEDIVRQNSVITESQLETDEELVKQIQTKLKALGLYPGGQFIDGGYGITTQNGLKEFCAAFSLSNMTSGRFDPTFAKQLLQTLQLKFILEQAKNREFVFNKLLAIDNRWTELYRPADDQIGLLAFLDRKIEYSAYEGEIPAYTERLKEKPDGTAVISNGEKIELSQPTRTVDFSTFPKLGELPEAGFEQQGLEFLDSAVTEACICVGSFLGGEVKVHWSGRNALRNVQFWSATKFIQVLNVVCRANAAFINVNIENCNIRGSEEQVGFPFLDLVEDIETYDEKIGTSDAIAAMFKRFETFVGLENWVKKLTGNQGLVFQGNYGEAAFRLFPQLFDRTKTENNILLDAAEQTEPGNNYVSAYDLTRLIAMFGWHSHLNRNAQLPGAQSGSLGGVAKAMGRDRSRYIDVAIETLGLSNVVTAPVIVSKLGLGDNSDLTYVAFVQFVDEHLKSGKQPAKLRTLAMALRVDGSKVASPVESDARMAAEVTEIMRRVVTEEFA